MKDPVMTRRSELETLMTEMRADETTAMQEAADLFESADMDAFTAKITDLRDRTIPGSHYDQIFTSILSVFNSTKNMLAEAFPAVPAVPASEQVVDQPASEATDDKAPAAE